MKKMKEIIIDVLNNEINNLETLLLSPEKVEYVANRIVKQMELNDTLVIDQDRVDIDKIMVMRLIEADTDFLEFILAIMSMEPNSQVELINKVIGKSK